MQLPKITNFNFMYLNDASEIDISGSYMPKVTTFKMQGADRATYSYITNRTKVLKANNITAPNITTLNHAFAYYRTVENIELTNFPTDNVTDMEGVFRDCYALKSLNVNSFNITKTPTLARFFQGLQNIESLDLSNWDTKHVEKFNQFLYQNYKLNDLKFTPDITSATTIKSMFCYCYELPSISFVPSDPINLTSMDFTFQDCHKLEELDLS